MLATLAKNKTGEKRRAMLWLHVVKRAGKDEFREQQFIACGNFTRHTALFLYNVIGRCEAQATKNALAAFELVKLQHIVSS